jgi:hypothetical protein
LIATLAWPGLVAVTVFEPVLPTTVATEIMLGVTWSTAEMGAGGTGLEFAAEEPTPMQPDVPMDAARRAEKNTRTAPRFECEEINVIFLFCLIYFHGAARFESPREQPGWTRTRVREC